MPPGDRRPATGPGGPKAGRHRNDEGDVHQGGRGQAADQRGGNHQQGPQDRRRAVRLRPAGSGVSGVSGVDPAGPAHAVPAHAAAWVVLGTTWNVTDWGADPTVAGEQMKPWVRWVPGTALMKPTGFTHTS